MSTQRYRKKPVVIEAMQWTGENIHDLWAWVTAEFLYGPIPAEPASSPDADGKGCDARPAQPARLYVAANDAWLDIEVGEWIIRDPLGFYPCKPDIFEATYEPVEQQIDDPGQWRAGDYVRIEWPNGSVLTGKARRDGASLMVPVAGPGGYSLDYDDGRKVTVTRKVEPIPEPTEWLSGVKFADGTAAARVFMFAPAWGESGAVSWGGLTWEDLLKRHGAPVAVSLPHWSDEADGLRVRVEKLLDDPPLIVSGIYRDLELSPMARGGVLRHEPDATPGAGACPGDNLTAWFDRLRALLAEGGEA